MASPLNTFKTVTAQLTTTNDVIYTAPTGITAIILMAQATNITNTSEEVTFSHFDTNSSEETELVKQYEIPVSDASGLVTGKLVVESGNSVKAFSSANSSIKLTLSVLESVNA